MNRFVFIGIKGLLIAASCAVGSGSAFAQVAGGAVPLPPTFSESVTSTNLATGVSSTQSGSGPYEVTNHVATAGTSYTLATEGEASLTINAGSTLVQQASATVTWNFIVNGPVDQIVFVGLQGRGQVNVVKPANGLDLDYAHATIYGDAFGTYNVSQSTNGVQNFGISAGNYLHTNTVYTIVESINAYSYPFGGTTDLVQASFDPELNLLDNSGLYSIALSPPPVPLPPTAWLMLSGLAVISWKRRQHRTAS